MNFPPQQQYPGQQQYGSPGGFPQQGYGQPAYGGGHGSLAPGANGTWGIKRSFGRALVWTIFTFGLYSYFYFYTYQKALDQQLGQDTATLRTVLLFIPFANIYSMYMFWEDINRASGSVGGRTYNSVVLLLICLIPFGAIYSYLTVHNTLMEYWDRRSNGQAHDSPYTSGEKIIIGLGIAFCVLYILFMILLFAVILAADSASSSF